MIAKPKSFQLQSAWPIVTIAVSAALLGGAYAFQYMGGLNPCQMCYWQRHAHKAVLAISVLAIIAGYAKASDKIRRALLILIALAFAASFALAFWHVGVEHLWWEGPKTCMVTPNAPGEFSAGSILDALKEPIKAPACSDVVWSMLGISMAGYNALISLLAAAMTIFVTFKRSAS